MDHQLNQLDCFLFILVFEVLVAIFKEKFFYEGGLNIFIIPKVPDKHIYNTLTIRCKLIIGSFMDSSD